MTRKKGGNPPKGGLRVRVKTAKGRKKSSIKWLDRQLNDPYVRMANKEGYRSRAVYKLLEINDKYDFLKPGALVVDLGAAPGSWAQIATKLGAKIIGIDLQEIEPIKGAEFITGDFLDEEVYSFLKSRIPSGVDAVLSDMAAASCGHAATDHIRIMGLCEAALDFALTILKPGGLFLAKVLKGGTEKELLKIMKEKFSVVKHIKPQASRKDSAEMYVIATGYKGHS